MARQIEWKLLKHQKAAMTAQSKVVAMSCSRAAGKTHLAAIKAIKTMAEGAKVLVVEPTYQQIRDIFYPEIEEILQDSGIRYSLNRSESTIKVGAGICLCRSADSPERFRGLNKIKCLIMDECGSYSRDTYNLAIPTMRKVKKIEILLVSTATTTMHWFARRAMRNDCTLINATLTDNIHLSDEYIETVKAEYADLPQPFIDRELYGKFTDEAGDSLFAGLNFTGDPKEGRIVCGLDIAGSGDDYTTFCVLQGNEIIAMTRTKTATDEQLRAKTAQVIGQYGVEQMCYDSTAIGHLISGLMGQGIGFGTGAGKVYGNQRALMYAKARGEMVAGMASRLPQADQLRLEEELGATKIDSKDRSKIYLIPKEDIKQAIGRSPDSADAFVLAVRAKQILEGKAKDVNLSRYNPFAQG